MKDERAKKVCLLTNSLANSSVTSFFIHYIVYFSNTTYSVWSRTFPNFHSNVNSDSYSIKLNYNLQDSWLGSKPIFLSHKLQVDINELITKLFIAIYTYNRIKYIYLHKYLIFSRKLLCEGEFFSISFQV